MELLTTARGPCDSFSKPSHILLLLLEKTIHLSTVNWLKGDSTELRQCKPFAASGAGQTFNVGGFGSIVSVVASFMEIPSLKELETIALGMQHRVTGQATPGAPGCFYSIMSNVLSRFPLTPEEA